MLIKVYDIQWNIDSDPEDVYPDLPETVVVDVDSEDEAIDAVSDETGFCISSANIEVL